MKKILLFAVASYITIAANAQCATNIDFNSWQIGGQPSNGNWNVQGGGSQVYQSVNGDPAFFISPFNMMNVHVSGSFRTTDGDEDWMGFVFSYLDPLTPTNNFDCWLYDWKQRQQNGASSGMALSRLNGVIPPANYTAQFWNHQNSPEFTVVQNNFGSAGWNQGTNHSFDLYLTYTKAEIWVDGVQKFDWQDCYKPGRFGFYNYSQSDCIYSNFQYSLFIDFLYSPQVCVGSSAFFNFIDPCVTTLGQYQSLTWNFGDGQSTVINSPSLANVNVTHNYASPGNYTATLTVVDGNGCTATSNHVVDVRNPITVTAVPTQPLCNGASNGGIALTTAGGFGGYTYNWSNATNGSTLVGAVAGTYAVTVTDGVCNTTAQYTLNQPTALTATTAHTDAPCGSNGTATITGSGGTPPYNVNWAGFPATSGVPYSMPAGTWIADFHDANNCSALLQYTETIASLPCGITSTVSKTNVSCWGGTNGTATLTVTGVTGTAVIVWNPGNINGTNGVPVTGLASGTYTYNYSDGNALHAFSGSVTITQPGAAMVAQLATTAISCPGSNTGQAIASVISGGTSPYSYNWNPAHANNPVVTGLPPGAISVTVTDASTCTATATGSVSGLASLSATFTTVIDSCYRSGKGSSIAHVSGGTAPYTYAWNNFDTDTANQNLIEGTYTLTVTDYNGCSISATSVITGPTVPFTRSFTSQDILCFGAATGNFNITTTGGTPGYTYSWNPATVSGSNPTGLVAGIYNFTVTDNYGCTAIGTDTLTQPASALTATTSHTDVTCNGANNGTITITVGGGTAPFSFLGNPAPTGTTTIPGLAPNTYAGNLTDANGCTVALSETITQPAAFTIGEAHINVACNGAATGSITITPSGGVPNYTYVWNGGIVTTQNRTNIAAGAYSVTATDNSLCTASVSVNITEPTILTLSETHTDVACNGASTGSITLTTTGGTAPNGFVWSDGPTTQNRTNLAAGNYSVTLTDNNLCSASVSAIITEPTALTLTELHTNILCNGASTGSITLTTTGGTFLNTFLWNDGPTTQDRTNLAVGSYSVTLTDNNLCTISVSATITEPAALTATTSHTNATCNGATDGTITITVGGGVAPYNFLGNPVPPGTNTVPGLALGNYAGNLTDANGCSVALSETITEPAAPVISVTATDALCFGGNGSATANPSGGGTFTYIWSNGGGNNQTITPPAGSYTVSASDANSCNQTASFTINQPTAVVVQPAQTNPLCAGATTGTITLTASGGNGATYTYAWTPNVSTTNTATALTAGSYDIIVSDANACTAAQNVVLIEPTAVNVNATATSALCFGSATGAVNATATGGVTPYSFSMGALTSSTGQFANIAAANYTVVVTDNNTCTASAVVTVNEPTQLTDMLVATDVSCYHYTDGQIAVTAAGGSSGYTYSLSTGTQNSTGTFTGLSTGNYSVTITDANTCSVTDVAVINEPDSVTLTVTPDPVTVNLGETLQLQTSTNQIGNITYNWLPAFGLSCYDCAAPIFSGNYSVVYTVTMATATGCTGKSTVNITLIPNYDVFIPNAFTPNGDGTNDHWQLFGNLPGIKQIEVKVFNRIGEKVFESTDINFMWDGTYQGTFVPGVYAYTAKFVWLNNHSDNSYKGTITLLR